MLVADAVRVKGLAPLACQRDKVDAGVLAELSFRELVPAIWLATPELRASASTHAGGAIWPSTARSSRTACTPR